MLMRIAYHLAHAGKAGDFFRRPLRVASGYDYLAARILAVNSTDGGAGTYNSAIRC